MNTIADESDSAPGRRRRRTHSAEFKAQVVAACRATGVSIAAVAMANGVNANLARRWVIAAEQRSGTQSPAVTSRPVPSTFVPLSLVPSATAPPPADIRIELRRGATTLSVSWPCAAAPECATWLRELLR